jgi:hypothetical protein
MTFNDSIFNYSNDANLLENRYERYQNDYSIVFLSIWQLELSQIAKLLEDRLK